MSFSRELKLEIVENKPIRVRHKLAQAYGLFLFGRSFSEEEISIHTEQEEIAELFCWFARDILGRKAAILSGHRQLTAKRICTVSIPEREDRRRILNHFHHTTGIRKERFGHPDELHAFLSGAYLACGNITDPQKSYHLEFLVKDPVVSGDLRELLEEAVPGVRRTTRRGSDLLYYKECAAIEDLLTSMGATKSCLAMIEIEMIKSVRNQANRATNCETANIDKLVSASSSQIEDIRLILRERGAESLPDNLRMVANLRLENPDLSLRELAEIAPVSISRSGMHHRLDKLSRLAAEIREQNRRGEGA